MRWPGRSMESANPFSPSGVEGLPFTLSLSKGADFRILLWLVLSWATVASAHPQGFHTKLTFTLEKGRVRGLVVMDVDAGERCRLIRSGADENHDGVLTGQEVGGLKAKLVSLATKPLKVGFSGFPLTLPVKEAKVSLHEDPRVGESGLSVAVLLELEHAYPVTPGLSFEVEDRAPDGSTVVVEVFQAQGGPGAFEPPFRQEVESGKKVRIRVGTLSDGG